MLRASLGKVKRAGTYAAKVPPQELHNIAVHVRAVDWTLFGRRDSHCGSLAIYVLCEANNQKRSSPAL
jgi:hypothetical protein